jgi:hypothetical protein
MVVVKVKPLVAVIRYHLGDYQKSALAKRKLVIH